MSAERNPEDLPPIYKATRAEFDLDSHPTEAGNAAAMPVISGTPARRVVF